MVSIRRRRLLGLSSGVQNSVENEASVHPMLLVDLNLPVRDVGDSFDRSDSPNVFNCNQQEDQNNKLQNVCDGPSSSKEPTPGVFVVDEVMKRRKQYRRRNTDNHVPMRGVYLKNYKWQAAIKVDKKQVHLGTLDSQDEAVHLYDRAAFICGREPNFELSQEEKQELRKLNWDDFLAMTRTAMSTKRSRRKHVGRPTVNSAQNSEDDSQHATEAPLSASDDAQLDRSTS